jgi:EAL domain-containing protein (putative c-di-GMP-specific phosphodiesterase class I)
MGVRIALDDTGLGSVSLRQLLLVRPDVIKLDVALVHGIEDDRRRQALVSSVLAFARSDGATVIAEGVETAATAATLLELGVTVAQGWFYDAPGPLPLRTSHYGPAAAQPSTGQRAS